jgi:hypothetical protein
MAKEEIKRQEEDRAQGQVIYNTAALDAGMVQ